MKKKKIIIILIVSSVIALISWILILLSTNETFFNTSYIGMNNQEIFIPKYSYFKEECCMFTDIFYSLRSKGDLQKEIDNYLSAFEQMEYNHTYGYKKGDLFIYSYKVYDKGLYREIMISY